METLQSIRLLLPLINVAVLLYDAYRYLRSDGRYMLLNANILKVLKAGCFLNILCNTLFFLYDLRDPSVSVLAIDLIAIAFCSFYWLLMFNTHQKLKVNTEHRTESESNFINNGKKPEGDDYKTGDDLTHTQRTIRVYEIWKKVFDSEDAEKITSFFMNRNRGDAMSIMTTYDILQKKWPKADAKEIITCIESLKRQS